MAGRQRVHLAGLLVLATCDCLRCRRCRRLVPRIALLRMLIRSHSRVRRCTLAMLLVLLPYLIEPLYVAKGHQLPWQFRLVFAGLVTLVNAQRGAVFRCCFRT